MIFTSKDRENLECVTQQLEMIFRDIVSTYIKVTDIQNDMRDVTARQFMRRYHVDMRQAERVCEEAEYLALGE